MGLAPVTLVDCTLREGEQTAGVSFDAAEKLVLVDALAAAGVSLLDAGMPAISEDERRFLRAAVGRGPARIGASVRALPAELRLAADCGCEELFIICPTSTLHRESRLGLDLPTWLVRVADVVRLSRKLGRTANVVCEDASRSLPDELHAVIDVALQGGAERIILCDTVGAWTPRATAALFAECRERHPGATLGVHCHNDFGLATANTLAAIEAGCQVPTATINGLGERAGNASLVEVAAGLRTLLGLDTGFDVTASVALSRLVESISGFFVPQQAPLVGFNAFRHESGIHVDGLLKDARNYERLAPGAVGRQHHFAAGKHTGRAWLRRFAEERGLPTDDDTLALVLERLKDMPRGPTRDATRALRGAIDAFNERHLGADPALIEVWFRQATERGR